MGSVEWSRLLLVANLIVANLARRSGGVIDWRNHAATGVPVTLASLWLAWLWLA
jgi:Na+/H+ antiporter NhaD/arsenite permease-like protein